MAAPIRKAVSVKGNRCVVLAGTGVLDRIGPDLKGAVGKPRRLALLVEDNRDPELALELRRLLVSEGFRVDECAIPSQKGALDLNAARDLATSLLTMGITADDALCVLGGGGAISLASFIASLWYGGVTCAAIACDLEAVVACPATPRALSVADASDLLLAPPALSFLYAESERCDFLAPSAGNLMGRALLVQDAVAANKRAYDALMESMDGLLANDPAALVAFALESAWERGRVISSSVAAHRLSLRYGERFARALEALLGERYPKARYLAEGMRFAARLGWQLAGLDATFVFDQDAVLEALELDLVPCDLGVEELLVAIKELWARRSNRSLFLLPQAPGMVRPHTVDDEVLREHLRGFAESRRALLEARS